MSETGHNKNVANFALLNTKAVALGAIYNPTATMIKLPALQAMLTGAQNAMTQVGATAAVEENAGKARGAAFEDNEKLATRVLNAYAAGDSDNLVYENLLTSVRKLRGKRAGDAPVDDPSTPTLTNRRRQFPSRSAATTARSRTGRRLSSCSKRSLTTTQTNPS